MCVLSMVMDHQSDEWMRRYWPNGWAPLTPPLPAIPGPTQQELDEFRRLLERAREYDQKMNQPDCELEEKRQKLRELSRALGVEITFV